MTIYQADTILDLLAQGRDDDPAIRAPDRKWLTYLGLRALARRTIADLNRLGFGRQDCMALVLPNGPEAAAAFVAVACAATAAPLNPACAADEFAFNLADLKVRGLIVMVGVETPAIAAARTAGIPVIWLVPGQDRPATYPCRRIRVRPAWPRNPAPRTPRTPRWLCTPPGPRPGPRSCR